MINLGVVYGGISTEHDVSKMSAKSVIDNVNKEKYNIHRMFIDKDGKWYNSSDEDKEEIENPLSALKKVDVVFPVLHGKGGEDGTIQGLFEMFDVPYVGCGVLASSVGMDKVYTKIIFEKAGLNQAPYVYIKVLDGENENFEKSYVIVNEDFSEEPINISKITEKIKYPMFVKPSSSGSSVGVKKATNDEELKEAIQYAGKFDNKVLVEQGIIGKEVECAVLNSKANDGEDTIASTVGEILPAEEFYSYDAKYNMSESKTPIPASIPQETIEEIRKQAVKAFKAIDGKGLSRVDFFVEEGTGKIIINEINTLPGFTKISMYPKLFEAVGINYSELLDRLIQNEI